MASFDPVKVLENVINRLRQHDPSGFFDDPVTDKEAPNYSQVITHPMCFSTMREKIRNRGYRTWGAFINDFELICANATVYNQQKSKVHKAAKTMLRQGKMDLQDAELEGRKAIYLLHMGGPAQAASEEAEGFAAQNEIAPINAFLLCPGHTPLPPPPGDDEEEKQTYYSCYSDTDSEDPRGQGAPTMGDSEKFFKSMDRSVTWIPWAGGVGVSSSGPAKEEVCPEWWKRRRPLEWQCRWLELRLLELQSHRYHYARSSKNPRSVPSASAGSRENGHERKQKKKMERHQFPDLSSEKLLKHPFLGLRVGALRVDDVCGSVAEVGSEDEQKSGGEVAEATQKDIGLGQDDFCFGAQVHVALGVLTEEMKKVMGLLQARRKSHQKLPPPRPLKKAPSTNPRKPLPRVDSKRSRREFEMEDMVTPVGLAQTTTTIERLPKTDIAVPRVETLSVEELSQRQKALDAWRPLLIADANTTAVPDEVKAVVKDSEEGDSEEEVTDQAFMLRHKDMESTEHERHVSVFGPPKKQKGAASGQRVLQRSASGPPVRDPGGRESGLSVNSHSMCLGDLNGRGRLRGRRPTIGHRPRPPIVQGGRRGGMSIGIPMISHQLQANQSQPLQYYPQTSASSLLTPAPLLANMAPFSTIGAFPSMMTSLPGVISPYSSPMMPISSFSGPAITPLQLSASMMANPIPSYENIQLPFSSAQGAQHPLDADGVETELEDGEELDIVESSPSQDQMTMEPGPEAELVPTVSLSSGTSAPIQMTQPPTLISTPVGPPPTSPAVHVAFNSTGPAQGVQLREHDVQNSQKTKDILSGASAANTPLGFGLPTPRASDTTASNPIPSWTPPETATSTPRSSSSLVPASLVMQSAQQLPLITTSMGQPWIQFMPNSGRTNTDVAQGVSELGPASEGLTRLPSGVLEVVEKPKVSDG